MQPFRGLRHGLLIAAAAFRSRCGRRSSSSYSSPFVLCWSLLRTTWFTKGISSMQQSLGPDTVLLSWTLNKKWTEHIAAVLHSWGNLLTTPWKDGFWLRANLLRKKAWKVWPLNVNTKSQELMPQTYKKRFVNNIPSDFIFCTTSATYLPIKRKKVFEDRKKTHHQHLKYQYILCKDDFPTLFYHSSGCQEMPLDAIRAKQKK